MSGFLRNAAQVGGTYFQHLKFINTAVAADRDKSGTMLEAYARTLSDQSFVGFKIMLVLFARGEKDTNRKRELQFLLLTADRTRKGDSVVSANLEPGKTSTEQDMNTPHDLYLQEDVDIVNGMILEKPKEAYAECLVDRIIGFDDRRYDFFMKNLHASQEATSTDFNNHKLGELNAWGPFFEDRMSYLFARERTGQKDPNFARVSSEYERSLDAISWAIDASPRIWQSLKRKRNADARPV